MKPAGELIQLAPRLAPRTCADPLQAGCTATVEPPVTICDQCEQRLDHQDALRSGTEVPLQVRLRRAGMPPLLQTYRWDGCKIPSAIEPELRRLVDRGLRFKPGGRYAIATLWGSVGAGKTGFAACWLRSRAEAGEPALWVPVPEWLGDLLAIRDPSDREQEISRAVRFPGLLVLDELVPDSVTPPRKDLMCRLLDHRINHLLATVCTTNHPLVTAVEGAQSVATTWGPRAASRLRAGWVFEWRGPDRRPPPATGRQGGPAHG